MTVSDTLIRAIESQNQGKLDTAVTLFEKTLTLDPKNSHAYYSLALIALNAGQEAKALEFAKKGTHAAPQFAPLWYLQGAILQRMGDKDAALMNFDKALQLQPDYPEVLLNSGALLRSMFRHKEALERFNHILGIDPNHTNALANCGILLTEFKQSAHAIKMFERLMELKPDYDYALGLLFYERMHICDWTGFESLRAQIVQGVRNGKRVCKSLAFMSASDSASDHQLAARIFADQYCPPAPKRLWNGERYQHDKLRIAYISPDFREHPVGHLMAGIFEHHDKNKFETIAISLGIDDHSRLRARMLKAFDKFIDAREMGASQIAQLMRDMEVDIAIDLGGFTSDTRTEVLALKPAPIQVNYLGYPGTMGTKFMDYILADRHIIPPEHHSFYNEKVAYLPDTYLPTDNSVKPSAHTPTRQQCGLPDNAFVFCSFSHDYKISPPVFDIWMNLLRNVPGSVLWLVSRGELTQNNLRATAQSKGVDPSRLVFASRVPLVEDHLARYRQADIFLDTHPYNAHTTAADALMVGLPVVTYMGDSFPSRVAGSLLHAVGMPELVTHSLEDYEALALRLACDRPLLQQVKAKLGTNRDTHALFNTPQFCRNLESVLLKMHAGLPTAVLPAPHAQTAKASELLKTPTAAANQNIRRLHIGGKVRCEGWEVFNVIPAPEVDHLGNAKDLSMFGDATFDVIYSSHVLEHFDYQDELHNTLVEWARVLKPDGRLQVCVPDLEALARLTLNKQLEPGQRYMAMRMMFGGHINAYDYHQVGLTEEILRDFLSQAGFEDIERVAPFKYFPDNSNYVYAGELISLNMQARKPVL